MVPDSGVYPSTSPSLDFAEMPQTELEMQVNGEPLVKLQTKVRNFLSHDLSQQLMIDHTMKARVQLISFLCPTIIRTNQSLFRDHYFVRIVHGTSAARSLNKTMPSQVIDFEPNDY